MSFSHAGFLLQNGEVTKYCNYSVEQLCCLVPGLF